MGHTVNNPMQNPSLDSHQAQVQLVPKDNPSDEPEELAEVFQISTIDRDVDLEELSGLSGEKGSYLAGVRQHMSSLRFLLGDELMLIHCE